MLNNKKVRMFLLQNRILSYIISKVFPTLETIIINKNLEEAIGEINKKSDSEFSNTNLTVETLEKLQQKEMERRKTIEDKAKITIAGITIAITFLSSGIAIINSLNDSFILQNKAYSIILLTIFIISFVYFVSSGISALKALNLTVIYDIYLNDELDLADKGLSVRLSKMVKNLQLNYNITPQKENSLSASYQDIKNGILLLLTGVLVLGTFYFVGDNQEHSNGISLNFNNFVQGEVIDITRTGNLEVETPYGTKNVSLSYIKLPYDSNPFHEVSLAYMEGLVLNRIIYLDFITSEKVIVYLEENNSVTLNEQLIKQGLSTVDDTTNNKIQEEILSLLKIKEKNAIQNNLGIWINNK